MADVQFKYSSADISWTTYIMGDGIAQAQADGVFIAANGYWYDANGTLHSAGSIAAWQMVNAFPQGPSLGLANL